MPPYDAQLSAAARVALDAPTTADLAERLYDRWYAPAAGEGHGLGPEEGAAHLRAADAASGRFEPGWRVLDATEAPGRMGGAPSPWHVPVACEEEVRWVAPADLVFPGRVGLRPTPGALVRVCARRDSVDVLPGWWTSMSRGWTLAPVAEPLVRLYWSVDPPQLCRVVAGVTACLDPAGRYVLKCPLDADRCRRPDAVVLFLPSAQWPAARAGVVAAHRRVRPWLRARIPALTLDLAPGLALAEDPGDQSFGTHRCRAVAGALAESRRAGVTDVEVLSTAARAALGAVGVDADAPWRNPGSSREYPWPVEEPR
ncbi:T3SS effector HopA1 family protein [Geodermatophilus sp. SYSU D00691]